ncbi:PPK2 family polyphosphate kinase [Schleiferilactobacillus perolens]|jgi:PPK2 family polyphosphate:nucleotide phosphotransferase|uniref:PPK2 family polyphosphate kinase n=1 Tax=Schleiferilactobacillus perolens TaxID=100468 RepID=UPI002353AE90|nr:PPK2 family polyphosphate kinase [Schleiferilactobacillus perolens]MCI2171993.1 polyphosphate kinase 2 family protein [Schleiferilactobacillus perolens]
MELKQYRYTGANHFKIADWSTTPPAEFQGKKDDIKKSIAQEVKKLADAQDKLYAQNRYSVLILFQAMDAAGKDGMIKHVMTGLNPQGIHVTPFKVPTSLELAHDYLWRERNAFPKSGEIAIFNRSYYEEVLVDKVHPENILNEHIPGIDGVDDITADFWYHRYEDLQYLETFAQRNGTIVLKFFLHLSKEEQRRRFLSRIEVPEKNWKFSAADIRERRFWDDYQEAYQDAIDHTATKITPWYVIPADDKWYARWIVSQIINARMAELPLHFPTVTKEQKLALASAMDQLKQ